MTISRTVVPELPSLSVGAQLAQSLAMADQAGIGADGTSHDELLRDARLLFVLDLFETGQLSSGKAAELWSMSRADFLSSASRAGVPVLDEADLAELPQ